MLYFIANLLSQFKVKNYTLENVNLTTVMLVSHTYATQSHFEAFFSKGEIPFSPKPENTHLLRKICL